MPYKRDLACVGGLAGVGDEGVEDGGFDLELGVGYRVYSGKICCISCVLRRVNMMILGSPTLTKSQLRFGHS